MKAARCVDYRMRHGVLMRTNGVNVMAALGLLPKEVFGKRIDRLRTQKIDSGAGGAGG